MKVFVVCGYGIPEDIQTDGNYLTYLRIVFNTIFARAAGEEAVIIPCGGPTSPTPPYTGTEARMIGDYLRGLMQRQEVAASTKAWNILEEDQSLSTLENLVFAKKIMDARNLRGEVTVFCEATREARLRAVGAKVFSPGPVTVEAIDFDHSKNRYADMEMTNKEEAVATENSLWTLEDPERLKIHHAFFEKKFVFLRQKQQEGMSHVDAIAQWNTIAPTWLAEMMPDSPTSKH